MTSPLDDRISRWEHSNNTTPSTNTKTLSVKVSPETAEHLTRLAKKMKTTRGALMGDIFADGYAKLCKAEKRIQRREQSAAVGEKALPRPEALDA